jgi:hypothetical protein
MASSETKISSRMEEKSGFKPKSISKKAKVEKISTSHSVEFLSSPFVKQCIVIKKAFMTQLKAYPLELLRAIVTDFEGPLSASDHKREIYDKIFNMLLEKSFRYSSLTPPINFYIMVGNITSPEISTYHLTQNSAFVNEFMLEYYGKSLEELRKTGGQPTMKEVLEYSSEQLKILFKINQIAIGSVVGKKELLINKYFSVMEFLGINLGTSDLETKTNLLEEVDIFSAIPQVTKENVPVTITLPQEEVETPPVVPVLNIFRKSTTPES